MRAGDSKVITRFAPSPTGALHIGSARTALYNFLFARQNGGKFILRIEDTDKERSKKEYEDDIVESLKWLGLDYDEFYRQSERGEIYKKYIKKLLDTGAAFVSRETEGERQEVIRFKNPNKRVKFQDLILGEIEFDTTDLGDFVIAKSLQEPLYNLTVVIDDCEMNVTHTIRGQDHISNTPRQILILEALGAPGPLYAHIPLILAPDRSKLSKRHGALSVLEYKEFGYLPEAILNFLALIGWHSKTEKEIFTLDELEKEFSLERVQKAGAVFDVKKLDFLNREHLKNLSEKEKLDFINQKIKNYELRPPAGRAGITNELLEKITPLIMERISKWGDLDEMLKAGELQYFWQMPEYPARILTWKDQAPAEARAHLEQVARLLEPAPDWSVESVKNTVWPYAEQNGRGGVLWPLRVALSGREKSPEPFLLASIIGRAETLARIGKAVSMLK